MEISPLCPQMVNGAAVTVPRLTLWGYGLYGCYIQYLLYKAPVKVSQHDQLHWKVRVV